MIARIAYPSGHQAAYACRPEDATGAGRIIQRGALVAVRWSADWIMSEGEGWRSARPEEVAELERLPAIAA